MTLEALTTFFGWMTVLNFGFLAVVAVALLTLRNWMTSVHARMFNLDEKALHGAYFGYLANYKLLVLVFSLAPYLALRLVA